MFVLSSFNLMTGHSVEELPYALVEMKMSEPWFALRELVVHGGRQDNHRWKDHKRGWMQRCDVQCSQGHIELRGQKKFHGGGGICGEPWKTWKVSVGGGGTVPVREQRQG